MVAISMSMRQVCLAFFSPLLALVRSLLNLTNWRGSITHPSKLQAAHTWCCLISRLTWSMLSVVCTTVYRPDGTGMASPWPPCLRVFLMPILWVGARIMPVCMWDSLSSVLFPPSIFIKRTSISRFKLYNFLSIIWLLIFLFFWYKLDMIEFVIKYTLQWL